MLGLTLAGGGAPTASVTGVEMAKFGRDGGEGTEGEQRQLAHLRQHLLRPGDVELVRRVGQGAFGEVFCGRCLGSPCAVKTMLHVTPENARQFRAEMLLTAHLRHPSIVNFVGACWGRDLTCLVLEWVPNGSLVTLLERESAAFTWDEPLLRLATDVAKGME